MSKMIKAEHDRLRPILFEDAPDWANVACRSEKGVWQHVGKKLLEPAFHGNWEWGSVQSYYCKNQPETTLDWKDTLIKRC